jgi:hypothetical protein
MHVPDQNSSTDQSSRYMNIFVSTWALLAAGLIFALPMLHYRVKDRTELADEALYVLNVPIFR